MFVNKNLSFVNLAYEYQEQQQMSKPVLSGRAMSVSNWNQINQNKEGKRNTINSHTRPSSNIGSEFTSNQIKEIYAIFQLNFSNLVVECCKNMTGNQNLIQNIGKMVKQIKKRHQKKTNQMEAEFRNIEMQLKLVRDSRDEALQKYKKLQVQFTNLSQKVKSRELDCFSKNEQIFQFKQKFQQMQKQLIVKNMEIKKVYQQWSLYKNDTSLRMEHYENQNYNLKLKNKKIKKQNERNVQALEYLQNSLKRQKQINQKQKFMKTHKLEAHNTDNESRQHSRNIQRDRSFSTIANKSHNRSRLQKPKPSPQQLLEQVKQLRENQSALLDRLAERDKLIQSLENSLSNSLIQ